MLSTRLCRAISTCVQRQPSWWSPARSAQELLLSARFSSGARQRKDLQVAGIETPTYIECCPQHDPRNSTSPSIKNIIFGNRRSSSAAISLLRTLCMIDIPRIKFSSPGFVPTPGRTGRRRDAAAAALASKTKGTARMGGRIGVGPIDCTSPLPRQHSGRPWASERTPGRGG